jgi:hypothetical protein
LLWTCFILDDKWVHTCICVMNDCLQKGAHHMPLVCAPLVIDTGNPWVFLSIPVPVPAHTPTHERGYRFVRVRVRVRLNTPTPWVGVWVSQSLSHSRKNYIFKQSTVYTTHMGRQQCQGGTRHRHCCCCDCYLPVSLLLWSPLLIAQTSGHACRHGGRHVHSVCV